jgi:hypothetical protein
MKIKMPPGVTDLPSSLIITGEEPVFTFPYLGSLITDDAVCRIELGAWLSMGQAIRSSLKKLWKSRDISMGKKIRLEKLSYGQWCHLGMKVKQ